MNPTTTNAQKKSDVHVGPKITTPYYLMKHYRFTNTEIIMKTNNSGLTFQQWIDQIDAILHKHFGITHVNINRDWQYHWLEADDPATQAGHVMSIDMPHTYAAHTNTYYSE